MDYATEAVFTEDIPCETDINHNNSCSSWSVEDYTSSSIAQTNTGLCTLSAVYTRVALTISAG